MERFSKLVCYMGWPWVTLKTLEEENRRKHQQELQKKKRQQEEEEEEERRRQMSKCNVVEATCRICEIIINDLLLENVYNSIAVALACNILFWGFIVFEVRGFAAASSAALVIVLCYSTLETQQEEKMPNFETWQTKSELIEKLATKVKVTCKSVFRMQTEQPRLFCALVFIIFSSLWLMGYDWDLFLIASTVCLSIIFSPMFLLRFPCKDVSKDWDNEIDEFLPSATEDDLHVLKRAGDDGDRSPTPPSISHDLLKEEYDLYGLSMPSHEDESTDGFELSELEFSASETDVDGIRFQTGYFERSSSSDDELELDVPSKKFTDVGEDSSDSEFDIIDSLEVSSLPSD